MWKLCQAFFLACSLPEFEIRPPSKESRSLIKPWNMVGQHFKGAFSELAGWALNLSRPLISLNSSKSRVSIFNLPMRMDEVVEVSRYIWANFRPGSHVIWYANIAKFCLPPVPFRWDFLLGIAWPGLVPRWRCYRSYLGQTHGRPRNSQQCHRWSRASVDRPSFGKRPLNPAPLETFHSTIVVFARLQKSRKAFLYSLYFACELPQKE